MGRIFRLFGPVVMAALLSVPGGTGARAADLFYSLAEAWRRYYNTERPHSSLGYKPSAPQAVLWPEPPHGSAPSSAQVMAQKPIMH